MDLDTVAGSRPVRRASLVAGVRAAAGDDRAGDEHGGAGRGHQPGQRAQGPARGRPGRGSPVARQNAYAAAITAIETGSGRPRPTG